MARRISFTRAERLAVELLVGFLDEADTDLCVRFVGHGEKHANVLKAARSLLEKMDRASEGPELAPGLGWKRFAELAGEVLGDRLALPPKPGPAWYQRVSSRLRDTGLDEQGARKVARAARTALPRGPISLEYLAVRITDLLARAEAAGLDGDPEEPGRKESGGRKSWGLREFRSDGEGDADGQDPS